MVNLINSINVSQIKNLLLLRHVERNLRNGELSTTQRLLFFFSHCQKRRNKYFTELQIDYPHEYGS